MSLLQGIPWAVFVLSDSAANLALRRATASSLNLVTVPTRPSGWLMTVLTSSVVLPAKQRMLTISRRNVALKIVEARTSSSNELDNLQRLKAPDTEEPRVVQLLDAFEHTSPNGRHQVLVLELVYPIDLFWYQGFRPVITRDALRQTIASLAFIHSRGMAHGGTFSIRFTVFDIA